MIRNGRAFFVSLVVHTAIAAAAIFALQSFQKEPPGEEAKLCIALSHFAEPVAQAPVKQPEPKPLSPKQVTKQKPKVVEKKAPLPEKRVEPVAVETPAPVVPKKVVEPETIEKSVEAEPQEAEVTEVAEELLSETADETDEAVAEVSETVPAEQSAPEPVPAMSAGERYLQEHLAVIAKLLQEHLYYPRMARKRGITGDVTVSFELLGSGEAVRVSVISGETGILNRAAVTTIERLSGRFPKPGEPITLQVPIRYRLQ